MNKKKNKGDSFVFKIDSKKLLRTIAKSLLNIFILLIVFFAGASLAVRDNILQKTAESTVVYVGQLTGKYQQVDNKVVSNLDFDLYWEVWDLIKAMHVDGKEISDKELFYGSLEGMVNAIDDPHSIFMDPVSNREFEDDMSGSFEGIGAEIGIRDRVLTIISPLDGTPAMEAGIMAGDRVIEINGTSTQDISLNDAVRQIRGPKGTEVVLTILRGDEILEIPIIRGTIVIKSVSMEALENDIYHIKINAFNADTDALFRDYANEINQKEAKGLILDLRNNPGGFLESSVSVLGSWIDGETALWEDFSDGRNIKFVAKGNNELRNIPTVVLINYGSASASEIVAGALQDYDLATIIGERSYGKGSVQSVQRLSDGSSVKITIAQWLTPLNNQIEDLGITPDEEVLLIFDDETEEVIDTQLNRAIEILSSEN